MASEMNEKELLEWVESHTRTEQMSGESVVDDYELALIEPADLRTLFTGMKLVPAEPDYKALAESWEKRFEVAASALAEVKAATDNWGGYSPGLDGSIITFNEGRLREVITSCISELEALAAFEKGKDNG